MKTLRIAAGLALAACFALFAGCTSTGAPAIVLPSPQQLFSQACPVVNADLKVLAASPLLSPAQQQVLNGTPGDPTKPGVIAINAAICSAGVQISVANLKAFHDSLLPAAIAIVQAVPAIPNQPVILLALQAFGPVVQQMIDGVIVAVAPASGTAAASAPAAASAAAPASATSASAQ